MQNTPRGLRRHIALFGKTNSGKSTLFNLLCGQDNAIVSDKAGTTTDPVLKSMELLPFGPVTLIDTAGIDDTSALGKQRINKTIEFARRADIGLIVIDASIDNVADDTDSSYNFFSGKKIKVFTKCDLIDGQSLNSIKEKYNNAFFVSDKDPNSIDALKDVLVKALTDMEQSDEDSFVCGIVPQGGTVVMVVPVDSEAPKGRLILPQVNLIRDCLDHGIKTCVTRETELQDMLASVTQVDLVVTDSQAFAVVNKIVPAHIPLTSFSIMLARQKGNFRQLLDGVNHIKELKQDDRILVLEACTHNSTHEDIGRVKIPKLLQKHSGKNLSFEFYSGYAMPDSLNGYALAILCGSCMINKTEMQSRLKLLADNHIPATNYGIILAYLNGILDRCVNMFK